MDADSKKKAAALAALDYLEDGMTVGVGTGSTVNHFIAALAARRHRIAGAVSSSEASTKLLREAGVEVHRLSRAARVLPQAVRPRLGAARRRRIPQESDHGDGHQ